MSELNWNLKPGKVYHLTLRAEQELFSLQPLAVVRHILGSSLAVALTRHPINLHCAGASATDLELLFSVTEQQRAHVRAFLEKLIHTAEEATMQFYPDAPERLFCGMYIACCESEEEADQRMAEILCRPVQHGYVDRVTDWQGYRAYPGAAAERSGIFAPAR